MKNFLFISLLLILAYSSKAQNVGINSTGASPDPSAILDISSPNKGLLIPRLDTNAITSPATGLMIFQPTDNGFYFYNSLEWELLGTVANLLTDLDGDTSIDPEVTPDSDEIIFKINGVETFKMDSTTIAFINTNNNTSVGNLAGRDLTTGGHNTLMGRDAGTNIETGDQNVAIGSAALVNTIDGEYNVAVGRRALRKLVAEDYNTGIGHEAGEAILSVGNTTVGALSMHRTTTGQRNSAIGMQALYRNQTGSNNVAAGYCSMGDSLDGNFNNGYGNFSLFRLKGGNENTAIGSYAGHLLLEGNKNIFIGNRSGGNDFAIFSNRLYIDVDDVNDPLIYGEFDNNKIKINGDLTITDSLSIPNGAIDGYIATSDANGVVYWSNPSMMTVNGWTVVGDSAVYTEDRYVGVGTIDPNADLEIVSPLGTSASQIIRSNQDVNLQLIADENDIGEKDNPLITMLQDGGKVGVYMGFENDSIGSNVFAIGTRNNFGTNVWDAFTINTQNNNIGIGTSNPTHPLHMSGGAFCEDGETWVDASDRRLKSDINDIKYGLTDIMKLRPVSYNSKSNQKAKIGFIAQEIRDIVPEVVSGVEGDLSKGETLGMSYGNLTALLVKGIQEQQQQIKNQNDQIKKLEDLVSQLIKNEK